jgi:hypothetical protein
VNAEQFAAATQETVVEREIAIRDSTWMVASSQRLLEQTRLFAQSREQPPR